jgi:hypothetical protein
MQISKPHMGIRSQGHCVTVALGRAGAAVSCEWTAEEALYA